MVEENPEAPADQAACSSILSSVRKLAHLEEPVQSLPAPNLPVAPPVGLVPNLGVARDLPLPAPLARFESGMSAFPLGPT